MKTETPGNTAHGEHGHTQLSHVVPAEVLVGVFGALVILTLVTVYLNQFDLGWANLVVAIGVASVKALLVAFFFMHLLYDRSFNALIFCVALVFVAIFVVLTLLDTVLYQPELQPPPPLVG